MLDTLLSALNRSVAETSVRLGTLLPLWRWALPCVGRSPCSGGRAVTGAGAHANSSQRASPHPGPRPGVWCVLDAVFPTEVGVAAAKNPSWMGSTEVELARQGTFGVSACCSPRRSGAFHRPFARRLPPTGVPPRWSAGARHAAWECDDSSHGVRSPSAYRAQAIVVPDCLTGTIRSQGFSPSQRFEPAWTVWLCFTPHPPMGFGNGLQSFSHSGSRAASRRSLLSCRFGWLRSASGEPDAGFRPRLLLNRRGLSLAVRLLVGSPYDPDSRLRHQLGCRPHRGGFEPERAAGTADRG